MNDRRRLCARLFIILSYEDLGVAFATSRDTLFNQKLIQFAIVCQALAHIRPVLMYEEQHEPCKYLGSSNVHTNY